MFRAMANGQRNWRERIGMGAAEALGALFLAACILALLFVATPLAKGFRHFMASLGGGG